MLIEILDVSEFADCVSDLGRNEFFIAGKMTIEQFHELANRIKAFHQKNQPKIEDKNIKIDGDNLIIREDFTGDEIIYFSDILKEKQSKCSE